jgi:Uma2 family endonuclease
MLRMNDMALDYTRRPITIEEYHRMDEAGIFAPGERVELLDGELIAVPPMGSPHAGSSGAINAILIRRIGARATVRPGLPIVIHPYSEPEPDFAIVTNSLSQWRDRHPEPGDVLFIVEVSSASLHFDLGRKAEAYSRAGIAEYWVVDVDNRRLVVHREPSAEGYGLTHILFPGDQVSPLAFPGEAFDVADFTG